METRANYILIGVFALLSILGTLAFFIWLASVQINKQYQTYGILFEDVSGLDPSGDVLFNGISVGKVIGLRIAPQDPSKVFTTIEVETEVPVRSDTTAQLQSQGVTGVAYISLSGGTPEAPPLVADAEGWRIIPSRRSTIQTLVQDAPDLLAEATVLLEQFQALTGPENQAHVTRILSNLDASSGNLDQALNDFSDITGTVREATAQITLFTERLDSIGAAVVTTLEQSDGTLSAATTTFETANTALNDALGVIQSVGGTFDQAKLILEEQVPEILAQVSQIGTQTTAAIADLQDRSGTTLDGFADTAELLNSRLTELETTLREANTAFVAVTEASDSFDALVDGDGTLLVAEARVVLGDTKEALATVQDVMLQDVPAIMTDIRAGVTTARQAVDNVATSLTTHLDPMAQDAQEAISSANALFVKAQSSLGTLDRTLEVAEGALGSAQTTFDGASDVLNTDLAPMMTDIRAASEQIALAITDVSKDMPAITSDLRALIARSDAVVRSVQATVSQSAPGISGFAGKGLPELTSLASEARSLVRTLGDLVRRIERDPARFILDGRVPEYRR
ncbi:Mce related protein [Sulfitobacter noctilucicola]|uniref:Phospholipid/cholesterol/gamma-HCH transport system substrate-binding protein n=1 Tax=Sulfitobacter noctilucicola TaxID=1342301 RepID=A0A7W6M6V2_9RHOB|nr:MlaD family protein [Sulfitobacter noctilucicola]KIN62695.1 Mce related protein [Sulfitobacter noctilucicola]MBB4172772.1 phospholipid/cholesterol/gamma-HCH transport system substrate-binding protein [Sulfitobacter noctilucicola]